MTRKPAMIPRAPDLRPGFSVEEKNFVRRFGTKALLVRFSGRDDMVGLRLLGRFIGFEIERGADGDRYLRALQLDEGTVRRTGRKLHLRYVYSLNFLVRGIRSWVR